MLLAIMLTIYQLTLILRSETLEHFECLPFVSFYAKTQKSNLQPRHMRWMKIVRVEFSLTFRQHRVFFMLVDLSLLPR